MCIFSEPEAVSPTVRSDELVGEGLRMRLQVFTHRAWRDRNCAILDTTPWRRFRAVTAVACPTPKSGYEKTIITILIATGMCLFGVGVLYLQIFAWHHLKVLTIFGAAMSSVGLCMLYDDLLNPRP